MATKKVSVDRVIAKEMPGFRVAKKAGEDTIAYKPDAVTPSLKDMKAKYKMPDASPRKRGGAKRDSGARSKSQIVVVESAAGSEGSDAPGKQLTVSVRNGKIRARQG